MGWVGGLGFREVLKYWAFRSFGFIISPLASVKDFDLESGMRHVMTNL